jgi:sulfur transfer protein SufE
MTVNEPTLPEAMEALNQLRDPQQRFVYLVERARKRLPFPEVYRSDKHRVEGCQVRTWWIGEIRSGHCWFGLDSDAVTLKALGGFLCEQASFLPLLEQQQFQADTLEKWGVLRQLADNRRATLLRLAAKIREFATNSGLSQDSK